MERNVIKYLGKDVNLNKEQAILTTYQLLSEINIHLEEKKTKRTKTYQISTEVKTKARGG